MGLGGPGHGANVSVSVMVCNKLNIFIWVINTA